MISQYCIIRDQTIISNGKIIFENQEARLSDFLMSAYSILKIGYPKFYKMDNLSKLGFLAAEVLLKGRTIVSEYSSGSIALVLSNAHASLDTDIRYAESAKTLGSPALFVYTLPNIVAGEICIRHQIKGENAFFITPSFDPELLVSYADLVLSQRSSNMQSPTLKACIAGWLDVMAEHHDVFLYLIEKNKPGLLEHSADELKKLYHKEVWNS